MKKSTKTIINVLLLLLCIIAVVTVAFIAKELHSLMQDKGDLQALIDVISNYPNYSQNDLRYHLDKLSEVNNLITKHAIWLVVQLVATIISLTVLALLNPFIFKKSTYTKHKENE